MNGNPDALHCELKFNLARAGHGFRVPYRSPLLKNLLHIATPLGTVILVFTLAFIPPIALSLLNGDGCTRGFTNGAGLCFVLGGSLWQLGRRQQRALKAHDGYLLVALIWALLALVAALPMWLEIAGLSATDAYFEATAALTTSGATVLTHLDRLPASLNLWRHELQWLGGFALLGLAMAVLPLLGIGGMQLYRTDSGGPIKDSRMSPRFRQTARSLWVIYLGLTALCILALRGAGMDWLDSVCHAFSTVSLGGFSTHDDNIGHFASPRIELVLVLFMVLAALNFTTHFSAIQQRSLRPYARDAEARGMALLLSGSLAAMVLYLLATDTYPSLGNSLRYAGFNLISLATGAGFFNTDFSLWPLAAPLWLLLLTCITASTGSTGGGIKMIRTLILFRQGRREIDTLMHPSAVQVVKIGGRRIPDEVVSSVLGFVQLYTGAALALTFLMILSGADLLTGFTAIVATLNNAGPGLGAVGPGHGFAALSDVQTWICTLSMLIGRMEIFILVVPLTPTFWRD